MLFRRFGVALFPRRIMLPFLQQRDRAESRWETGKLKRKESASSTAAHRYPENSIRWLCATVSLTSSLTTHGSTKGAVQLDLLDRHESAGPPVSLRIAGRTWRRREREILHEWNGF